MRSTRQLSITLPNEIAELVRAKVATGVYATESEVIRDGLRSLLARDRRRGLAARKGGSRLRRPQGRSISCGTSGQGARGTIGPKQESRREEARDSLSPPPHPREPAATRRLPSNLGSSVFLCALRGENRIPSTAAPESRCTLYPVPCTLNPVP
jgi:putative addiction module CopG family antidote